MPQVKHGRASAWRLSLLGTVAIAAAGPALAQVDVPRIGAPASPEPAADASVVQQSELGPERPGAEGPGALGGRLARPGGTTRDDETLDLPIGPAALDGASTARGGRPTGIDRGVTVAGRSRPNYEPIGARLGAFTLNSSATAALGFDGNVFQQNDGVSDPYATIRAGADLRSDYARHQVDFDVAADQRVYASYGSENALTYAAHVRGRLDLNARDSVSVNITREHQIIERGAVGEVLPTRRPIRFDLTGSGVSGRKLFGPLTVDLAGLINRFDYQDARDPAGVPVDQDFRDFNLYELRADVAYNRGGAASLFGSITGEARRFRVSAPPIDRDSDVIEVLGGIRGEITPLIRGQFGLGYIYADFKDPTLDSVGGLAIGVGLEYLVTQLTTVQLSGRRRLQNVGSVTAPASLTTELRLGADHELLRNLIVSAGAGYQDADYVGDRGAARRYTLDLGARYLIDRRFRLGADIDYRQRDGGGGLVGSFERVQARASVTVNL